MPGPRSSTVSVMRSPFGAGFDHDLGRRAIDLARFRTGIFDGVVDQIGQCLTYQLAIAPHRRRQWRLDLERESVLLGERLVQLTDVARNFGGVEFSHVIARVAGLGACNHQQGVKGPNEFIGLGNGQFQRRAVIAIASGGAQGLLTAVAQAGERCLQIVRDIVGDFLQPAHQRLDAFQHGVDVFSEPVEFVAGAGDRQATGQIAGHDGVRCVGHGIDPLEHAAADEKSSGHSEHHYQRE